MSNTENNVAAQAGDEPMRLVSANLLDRAVALLQSSGQMGVAHQLKECVSPRAITAVTEALQVCVKALEFRKERSANDEFALNLARIALAESPRATADVERMRDLIAAEVANNWPMRKYSLEEIEIKLGEIDVARLATTKPGA